jgi:4-amino-4-deoxy-L-arabinose transferase-like glycosyltransferase
MSERAFGQSRWRDIPNPAILWLLAATFIVYLLPAGRAILDDGDALYAHIAAEMITRGDWVTPYANGVRFLDKPPLMYWLMATSYLIFGVSEWAARLPTAIGIFITALLLYRLGKRSAGERAGLIAGLAFILSAGTLFFTLEAFPDIFLVLCLTLAFSSFLSLHLDQPTTVWPVIGLAAALAGAVLAKSLIGMLFPLAAIGLFLISRREWPRLRLTQSLIGLGLFILLTLPWHVLAATRNPGFLRHYFINEQALRFLGRREPIDYGSIPTPLFWALLLVWFFPWSVFLPATWKLKGKDEESAAIIRLAFCWAAVVIGFFTFSSRLEHYSFPALPPLALLIGLALENRESKAVKRAFNGLAVLGAMMGVAATSVLVWWWMGGAKLLENAPDGARDRAFTNLFSPLWELPAATRARLVVPLIGTLVIFAVGMIGAWWFERSRARSRAIGLLAVMMTAFCLTAIYSLHLCEGLLSSKQFGLALQQTVTSNARVVVVGDFETANSINFYAPVQLLLYEGKADSIAQGLRFADAPPMIISRDRLEALWGGAERVFILAPRQEFVRLGLLAPQIVMEDAGRVLAANRR